MKVSLSWILVVWALLLGACQPSIESPDTAQPAAVITEDMPEAESSDPIATATVEARENQRATAVAEVNATATSAAIATQNAPQNTPQPAPTEADMPDIGATVMALEEPRLLESFSSPDGQWRVDILIYDCVETASDTQNALDQLVLVNLDDGTQQVVDDQAQYCGGLGAFGLGGRFWSQNSRYFYYTSAREGVPDGGWGAWTPPILRLDVNDFSVLKLGGGPLSPDHTLLATWNRLELAMWDVNEGEKRPLLELAPEQSPSTIVWSPAGDSFAYLYWQLVAGSPIGGTSYVGFVDLDTMEPNLVIESQSPGLATMTWDSPDELTLQDWDGQTWIYDFGTGELRQAD